MRIHEPAWRVVAEGLLTRGADKREELAALITAPEVAWPEVVYLADSQYVTPGLWHAFVQKGLAAHLPDEAAQYLRAVYEMNRKRNEALKRQLAEILECLADRGVTVGLIKGAALLQAGVYTDPAARVMTDLDVLVAEAELEETARALRGLGYGHLDEPETDPDMHHHLPAFFRAGEFASFEVHSEPLNREARPLLTAAEVWRGATDCGAAGHSFRVPSPSHSVLLAMVHSEVADRNLRKLKVSLRAFQDVLALVDQHGSTVDWPAIAARMQRAGQRGVYEDFLYILGAVSGDRSLPVSPERLRSRARYAGCRLALRHRDIETWLVRFHDLSAYRLSQRFGGEQNFLTRQRNRLRVLANFFTRSATGRQK